MGDFYLMTKTGTTPPKYVHHSIGSARTEAERLANALDCDVLILEVVGKVFTEEVPVTKKVKRTIISERLSETDDLPF